MIVIHRSKPANDCQQKVPSFGRGTTTTTGQDHFADANYDWAKDT